VESADLPGFLLVPHRVDGCHDGPLQAEKRLQAARAAARRASGFIWLLPTANSAVGANIVNWQEMRGAIMQMRRPRGNRRHSLGRACRANPGRRLRHAAKSLVHLSEM
jgi:hypothetical protein